MAEETTLDRVFPADAGRIAPEVREELLDLAQGARETISRRWSPHTRRTYAGAWSRFREWTRARGLASLPADPATLLAYLQHLVVEGKGKATVRSAASAVAAAHRPGGSPAETTPPSTRT